MFGKHIKNGLFNRVIMSQSDKSSCQKATNSANAAAGALSGRRAASRVPRKQDLYKELLIRKGNVLPTPSNITFDVIASGIGGCPKAVVLSTPQSRYLFNSGEGTQRILSGRNMKMGRIENVFITHRSWDNVSGLLSLCLTLQSQGLKKISFHGPPDITNMVTSSWKFAHLADLEITACESGSVFEDHVMRVESLPLYPDGHNTPPSSPVAKRAKKSPNRFGNNSSDEDGTTRAQEAKVTMKSDTAILYLCHPHEKQRNIVLEKCVALGLSAGPVLGELKRGEDVIMEDGRVITQEDVLMPKEPNRPFIVMECPDVKYINSLLDMPDLVNHYSDAVNEETCVDVVVHFSPLEVVMDTRYRDWMSRFGGKTQHLMVNELGTATIFEWPYIIQAQVNLIHKQVFPLLPLQIEADEQTPSVIAAMKLLLNSGLNVTAAETGLSYILRGKINERKFTRENCVKLNNKEYTEDVLRDSEFAESLEKCLQAITAISEQDKSSLQVFSPEVLFLGTGSSVPSKHRNVSGILVHTSPSACILLDCGENTYIQMYRHYGKQEVDDILLGLKAIFISHLHADHHMGVISVARERHRVLKSRNLPLTPLVLIAPHSLALWYTCLNLFPLNSLLRIIPVDRFLYDKEEAGEKETDLLNELDLNNIKTVRVIHPQKAHAIILTNKAGQQIAYSGDTMPCDNFIEAAKGCDLLIHEATMDDSLADRARAAKHSTTSQALDVGHRMEAKFILLTHFSQRYPKIPMLNEAFTDMVGIAFDNMRVRLNQLHLLPHFIPVLKELFADEHEMLKVKKRRRMADNNS